MDTFKLSNPEREIELYRNVSKRQIGVFLSALETNELELIFLKTHLLFEQELESIIANSFKNPDIILKSNFTFNNKLIIVEAILKEELNLLTFSNIKIISKIRNEMSHNIQSDKIISLIKILNNTLVFQENNKLNDVEIDKLKITLANIYGCLIAIVEVLKLDNEGIKIYPVTINTDDKIENDKQDA